MQVIQTPKQDSCADRERFWEQFVLDCARLPWATAVMSIPIKDLSPDTIAERLNIPALCEVILMPTPEYERFEGWASVYMQSPMNQHAPLFKVEAKA